MWLLVVAGWVLLTIAPIAIAIGVLLLRKGRKAAGILLCIIGGIPLAIHLAGGIFSLMLFR